MLHWHNTCQCTVTSHVMSLQRASCRVQIDGCVIFECTFVNRALLWLNLQLPLFLVYSDLRSMHGACIDQKINKRYKSKHCPSSLFRCSKGIIKLFTIFLWAFAIEMIISKQFAQKCIMFLHLMWTVWNKSIIQPSDVYSYLCSLHWTMKAFYYWATK